MAQRADLIISTTTSVSPVWRSNQHVTPFAIGLGAVIVSGTPHCHVEHTFDELLEAALVAAHMAAQVFSFEDVEVGVGHRARHRVSAQVKKEVKRLEARAEKAGGKS